MKDTHDIRLNVGRVLWINHRDGFGVIEDPAGNEWYFDSSVADFDALKRNDTVKFVHNTRIKDCLCAQNVTSEVI